MITQKDGGMSEFYQNYRTTSISCENFGKFGTLEIIFLKLWIRC